MKKSLFALALAACFAFGTFECEKFEKECNDDNMESCYKAGLLCENNATSFKLFEKACNGGCEEGCLSASEIIMQEDSKKGIRYLEKNCNAKCTICCGLLGIKYSLGVDVEKDISKGITYYDKACDGGEELSCSMLADMYDKGKGVKKDEMRAAVYYKKGCDIAGDLPSCFNFAVFNYNINDKSKAAQYFKKACDLGKNKNSLFMNLPEFKETWQKSYDMYELLK